MSLKVNGEAVESKQILEEMERLRPDYERVFQDMDIDEREDQQLEWARENIVERILIQQHAKADSREIPKNAINKQYRELKKNHKVKSFTEVLL